jgi:hypothetical protein
MSVDFSFLQNIDFTSRDNLIFLVIFFVIFIIALSVFIFVARETIWMVRRIIIRAFNLNVRRPKFARTRNEDIKDKEEGITTLIPPKSASGVAVPQPKVMPMPGHQSGGINYEPKTPPTSGYSIPSKAHAIQKDEENKVNNSSMFKGESEVSRIKLEHEMRTDKNIWKVGKEEGLTLNPTERAELVKEIFAPVYGTNISKTDLKQGIRKLNQKMMGTKDMGEHAKIRKEIKFFKKIGGIK